MPFSELDGTELAGVLVEQQPDGHWFHVRRSFRYEDPILGKRVVVPLGLRTDLASVPWFMWWLVASYGRHTAAALVHDHLVRGEMTRAERIEADAIFFHALEESGNNWFRHRIMFAAVSAGLTMRKAAPALFLLFFAQLFAFWVAVLWGIGGLGWLQRQPWVSWFPPAGWTDFGADRPYAWQAALLIGLAGFVWARLPTADPELAWWLWPASVAAIGVISLPVLVIVLSVAVVFAIDLAAAAGQALRGRGWEMPTAPRPTFRV